MNENQNYEDIAILIKCEMDHTWISQFKDTLNERVIDELYKIKYLNKPLEKDKIIEEEIKEDIAAKHKFKGDVKAEKKREEAFRKKQKVQDRIKQIDRKTLRDTGKKIKDEMSEEKPEARRMMVEATFKKKVRSRPKSNAEHQKKKLDAQIERARIIREKKEGKPVKKTLVGVELNPGPSFYFPESDDVNNLIVDHWEGNFVEDVKVMELFPSPIIGELEPETFDAGVVGMDINDLHQYMLDHTDAQVDDLIYFGDNYIGFIIEPNSEDEYSHVSPSDFDLTSDEDMDDYNSFLLDSYALGHIDNDEDVPYELLTEMAFYDLLWMLQSLVPDVDDQMPELIGIEENPGPFSNDLINPYSDDEDEVKCEAEEEIEFDAEQHKLDFIKAQISKLDEESRKPINRFKKVFTTLLGDHAQYNMHEASRLAVLMYQLYYSTSADLTAAAIYNYASVKPTMVPNLIKTLAATGIVELLKMTFKPKHEVMKPESWIKDVGLTDGFKDIKSFLNVVLDSSASTAIRNVVLTLASFHFFDKDIAHKLYDYFGKPVAMTVMEAIQMCLDSITTLLRVLDLVLDGVPITTAMFSGNPLTIAFENTKILLVYKDRLYSAMPVPGYMDRSVWCVQVNELINFFSAMKAKTNPIKKEGREISEAIMSLTKAYLDIRCKVLAEGRRAPFAIQVVGPPCIGKTQVVYGLFGMHCKVVKRVFKRNMVYTKQSLDEFWGAYEMLEQPYIHIPELGQLHRNIAKTQGDPSVVEMLKIIDNICYPVPMAAVEDKGKVFCLADMVVLDTNVRLMNVDLVTNTPSAVMRRVYTLDMFVKKEYRKDNHDFMIDPEKCFDGTRYYDKYDFMLSENIPIPPGPDGSCISQRVLFKGNYDGLTNVVKDLVRRKIIRETKNQEAQLNAINNEQYGDESFEPLSDEDIAKMGLLKPIIVNDTGITAKILDLPEISKLDREKMISEAWHQHRIPLPALTWRDWFLWSQMAFWHTLDVTSDASSYMSTCIAEWYINEGKPKGNFLITLCFILNIILIWYFGLSRLSMLFIFTLFCIFYNIWRTHVVQAILVYERVQKLEQLKISVLKWKSLFGIISDSLYSFGSRNAIAIASFTAAAIGIAIIVRTYQFWRESDGKDKDPRIESKNNDLKVHFCEEKCHVEERKCEFKSESDHIDDEELLAFEKLMGCGRSYTKVGNKAIKQSLWNTVHLTPSLHTSDVRSLWDSLDRNVRLVDIEFGKDEWTTTTILGLCGNFAIINTHALRQFKGSVTVHVYPLGSVKKSTDMRFSSCVRRDKDTIHLGNDVTVIRLSSVLFSDITKHINGEVPDRMIGIVCGKNTEIFSDGNPIEMTGKYDYVIVKPLTYLLPGHMIGLCGQPIVAQRTNGSSIVGIHAGGKENSDRSCGVPLVLEDIEKAIEVLTSNTILVTMVSESLDNLPVTTLPISKSAFYYESLHGVDYFGKVEGPVLPNSKSKLVPTPLMREYIEEFDEIMDEELQYKRTKKFGPPLMNAIRRDGVYVNPINVSLRKISKRKAPLDRNILERVLEELLEFSVTYLKEKGITNVSPIDMETAINGSLEDEYIRRIKASTAAGFGWSGKKSKYLTLIDEFCRVPTSEMLEQSKCCLKRYAYGKTCNPINKGILKDEPRSEKKILSGETRMFYPVPTHFLIVLRMLLQPLYALMVEHGDAFKSAVGIDMYSEAERIFNIHEFSEYIEEGDWKEFDTGMPFDISWASNSFFYRLAERLGYGSFALKLMLGILTDTLFPWVVVLNDLFRAAGLQPSGTAGTAESNCIRNIIILMYCWYSMGHIEPFLKHNETRTYGDDLLNAVDPVYKDTFNNVTLAKFAKEKLFMEYTSAAKDGTLSEFVNKNEMTFLKRNFVFSDKFSRIVAPLDKESLMRMLLWYIPSNFVSVEQQMRDTISSFLNDLMFHANEDSFNRIRSFLIGKHRAYFNLSVEFCASIPTYQEIMNRLLE